MRSRTIAAAASPSGRIRGEVREHGQCLPRQAIGIVTVDQRPVRPGCDDFAVRIGVGGQDDTARRHRLQQRAGDRVGPARGNVQVAGGQDLGHDRGRRSCPGTRAGRDRTAVLCQQVSGVIAVVKLDVQPAPDDRVAHDDAQHVGSSPKQRVGDGQEPVEPAKAVERSGHETDDPRSCRNRPGRQSTAAACPVRVPRRSGEAAGVDAIVQDQEFVAILGRKQSALPVGGSPAQRGLFQVQEIDRGHRPPPVKVGRGGLGPGLVGQVVAVGVVEVIEEVDHGSGRPVDRREEARAQARRAAHDQVDRPRPLLLEDFPAAVGIAEAALERRDQVTADSRATPPTPKTWTSSPLPTDAGQKSRGSAVWQ